MISFKEYLDSVDRVYYDNAFILRYGQTIMNVLYEVWPTKYSEITSTENDCFYNDGMVKTTLEKLEKEWIN